MMLHSSVEISSAKMPKGILLSVVVPSFSCEMSHVTLDSILELVDSIWIFLFRKSVTVSG